jgi:hypothetical protein
MARRDAKKMAKKKEGKGKKNVKIGPVSKKISSLDRRRLERMVTNGEREGANAYAEAAEKCGFVPHTIGEALAIVEHNPHKARVKALRIAEERPGGLSQNTQLIMNDYNIHRRKKI